MIPFSVIMSQEFRDGAPELPLVEEDHPIQAFGLDRSYEAFCVRKEVGTPRRQLDHLHSGCLEDLGEAAREQRAAIVDQISLAP